MVTATRSDVKMVTGTINGQEVTVPAGTSSSKLPHGRTSRSPTSAYQPMLRAWGSCRICTVEILGKRGGLIESCATPLGDGMEVLTHSHLRDRSAAVHPADVPDRPRAGLPDVRQVRRVLPAGQHVPAQHQRQSVPAAKVRPAVHPLQRHSSTTSGTAASCATAARASAMR